MIVNHKASYYARSALERAADELEFQRRYQHGLRVQARLPLLQARYKGYMPL